MICKETCCGKEHSVTDVLKAYYVLNSIDITYGMYNHLLNEDYTEEEWTQAEKTFALLEALNCCCDDCKDC